MPHGQQEAVQPSALVRIALVVRENRVDKTLEGDERDGQHGVAEGREYGEGAHGGAAREEDDEACT